MLVFLSSLSHGHIISQRFRSFPTLSRRLLLAGHFHVTLPASSKIISKGYPQCPSAAGLLQHLLRNGSCIWINNDQQKKSSNTSIWTDRIREAWGHPPLSFQPVKNGDKSSHQVHQFFVEGQQTKWIKLDQAWSSMIKHDETEKHQTGSNWIKLDQTGSNRIKQKRFQLSMFVGVFPATPSLSNDLDTVAD